MGLRYSCKAAQVSQAGTTFYHNLDGPQGTGVAGAAAANASTGQGINYYGQAPDEWKANLRGPTPGAVAIYLVSTPTSQSIVWAASGATGTADIFCAINHSFIQ